MDIKIPSGSGPGQIDKIVEDATQSVTDTPATTPTNQTAAVAESSIEQVASQVAKGEISSEEAVDQLIAHVLDSKMVDAAPQELRAELGEVLRTMLETDPHLQSLVASIGDE
jgi:hypothetical protein